MESPRLVQTSWCTLSTTETRRLETTLEPWPLFGLPFHARPVTASKLCDSFAMLFLETAPWALTCRLLCPLIHAVLLILHVRGINCFVWLHCPVCACCASAVSERCIWERSFYTRHSAIAPMHILMVTQLSFVTSKCSLQCYMWAQLYHLVTQARWAKYISIKTSDNLLNSSKYHALDKC